MHVTRSVRKCCTRLINCVLWIFHKVNSDCTMFLSNKRAFTRSQFSWILVSNTDISKTSRCPISRLCFWSSQDPLSQSGPYSRPQTRQQLAVSKLVCPLCTRREDAPQSRKRSMIISVFWMSLPPLTSSSGGSIKLRTSQFSQRLRLQLLQYPRLRLVLKERSREAN